MGRLLRGGRREIPAELATYDPELWESRVMASSWADEQRGRLVGNGKANDTVAKHVAYYLPYEAKNLYAEAVEALRLPREVEEPLVRAAIGVALRRAVAASDEFAG
jgi:hypothetical protein